MSDRQTDTLLRELTDDLQPVRRIPRLRSVALLAVGGGVAAAAINTAITGWPFPFTTGRLPSGEGSFLMTLAGLVLAAGGALVAALAGAVPGRDVAARSGRLSAVVGVALAVGGATWWALITGAKEAVLPLGSCFGCASHALALALPPALVVGFFLGRALARRPLALSVFAAIGALALGAGFVHASCTDGGALHVALGHVVAPLVLAPFLAWPLSWLARRGAGPVLAVRD